MTLSLSIATIAWFSKNFTLWSYDYDTFQPKIGQCDSAHIFAKEKAGIWLQNIIREFWSEKQMTSLIVSAAVEL